MAKSRKRKERNRMLGLALLHTVNCTSGDLYCEACELAERVVLQEKDMAKRQDTLDKLPGSGEVSRWRPMSLLPEEPGWYTCYAATADPDRPLIVQCFYGRDPDGWTGIVHYWLRELTHWMPLPFPPDNEGVRLETVQDIPLPQNHYRDVEDNEDAPEKEVKTVPLSELMDVMTTLMARGVPVGERAEAMRTAMLEKKEEEYAGN